MGFLGFLGAICFPFKKPAPPTLESILRDHGSKIADGQMVLRNNMTMAQAVEKVNSYFPAKTYSTIAVIGTEMHGDSLSL